MAKGLEFTTGIPGFSVWIEYNPANLRISTVSWTVPAGMALRVKIWFQGSLAVDRTLGQGTGSESIPGNLRMVSTPDGLDIPASLSVEFQAESIG
jgi:hypothetical protein